MFELGFVVVVGLVLLPISPCWLLLVPGTVVPVLVFVPVVLVPMPGVVGLVVEVPGEPIVPGEPTVPVPVLELLSVPMVPGFDTALPGVPLPALLPMLPVLSLGFVGVTEPGVGGTPGVEVAPGELLEPVPDWANALPASTIEAPTLHAANKFFFTMEILLVDVER